MPRQALGRSTVYKQALGRLSRTYCVSVRDRSEYLLNIKHTDGFELNGVGALQTRACRGMGV